MGYPSLQSPPTARTVHLCIDMQRIFSSDGLWATPWMSRVLPFVAELAGRFPQRTVFSRFIPPERPEEMPGTSRLSAPPLDAVVGSLTRDQETRVARRHQTASAE